jgi:ParB-like chromosome segregation protein Spo0J
MDFHEAADIFPLDEENLPGLADDIRANGQKQPIEVFQGKILDGRRRFKACRMAGVEPKFVDVSPPDPVGHVLSLNRHRRHLSGTDLAMVGARTETLREMYAREAEERRRESTSRAGKASGASRRGESNVQELVPDRSSAKQARDQLGEQLGVSGRYIDHARRVIAEAPPEVVKAIDEKRMTLRQAVGLLGESAEVQKEAAAKASKANGRVRKGGGPPAAEEAGPGGGREIKQLGVGVIRAHEAINSLIRIPKDDALRKQGFRLVTDWIRANP